MRFMILVKASPESEAGVMPGEDLLAAMGAYHEELAHAGVLLDGVGLKASAQGWRVRYGKPDEPPDLPSPTAQPPPAAAAGAFVHRVRHPACGGASGGQQCERAQWRCVD